MALAQRLAYTWGEGRVSVVSTFVALGTAILPVWAPNPFWFGFGLVAMGFAGGTMGVAFNALVTQLERETGHQLMITCHGFWSLGGLLGASITSFIIGAGIPYQWHWLVFAGLLTIWMLWEVGPRIWTLRTEQQEKPKGKALTLPSRPVMGLALIGLFVMVCEGAAADWSGVYLAEVLHADPYLIGMGYASYSLCMTLARFYGDVLFKRAGGLRMIRYGAFLACLGLGLVLIPWLPIVLLGFCLMGLGYSSVVPVLITYAGNVPDLPPALGIASVASAGYIGFLGGPVLIGFMAGQFGLSMGYAVFSMMLTVSAFLLAPRALSWAR